jgi:hypothetical protein
LGKTVQPNMVTPSPLPPEARAEILRVMHTLTAGAPELDPVRYVELAAGQLTPREFGILDGHSPDDLALLNACLTMEHELREQAFYALERLLALVQWSEGSLDERLRALPYRAFGRAAICLYELGWITKTKED